MSVEVGSNHWRNRHRIARERAAIDRVVAHLEADGFAVTDLWFPDLDRDDPRVAGRTTPDAAMLIDGRDAAVDVTSMWPDDVATASARATEIGTVIESAVRADDGLRSMSTAVAIRYDVAGLLRLSRRRRMSDAARVAGGVLEALRQGPTSGRSVVVARRPPWLTFIRVTVDADDDQQSTTVVLRPDLDPRDVVDCVLDRTIPKKHAQLAPWGLEILLLDHGPLERLEDVVAAMRDRGHLPFWRIYWNDPGSIHLVWDRAERERPARRPVARSDGGGDDRIRTGE